MDAEARIVAEADTRGATRLTVLHSQVPLLLRRTRTDCGGAQVHIVGGAAGPLGGDRLRLRIDVGPGAMLQLRTVAASLALPGHHGGRSTLDLCARVADGGRLTWLPEPTIAAAKCHHHVRSSIEVAPEAYLAWRDELVCGRDGERPGDATIATRLRIGGRPILDQRLAVGPDATGWDGPAVLGAGRATGSLLVVDPLWAEAGGSPPAQVLGPTAAICPLTAHAVVATATGENASQVRDHLNLAARILQAYDGGQTGWSCSGVTMTDPVRGRRNVS